MASASWQEEIRIRLVERNRRESAYAPIIEQYRKLASTARTLTERNRALLKAVSSPGRSAATGGSQVHLPSSDAGGAPSEYIASLMSELTSLKEENAVVYKTQSQNAQRLLSMTETLREREEALRIEVDNLRKAQEEVASLRRRVEQHDELMTEKDRGVQMLHDEIQNLNLELNQVISRNEVLKVDNASLLQRWIDKMNETANDLNAANSFYEDMRSRGWKNKGGGPPHTAGPGGGGADDRSEASTGNESSLDDGDDPFLRNPDDEPPARHRTRLSPNG